VSAHNEVLFNKAIKKLMKVNFEVTDWLLFDDRPKHTWVRHTFDPLSKSIHVTNNVCEIFNSWVGADKSKTMLAMLESVIKRVMVIFQKMYAKVVVTHFKMTSRTRIILDKTT